MDHSPEQAASFIAAFAAVYIITIIVIVAFTIWMYWRIFEKAGYSGALSLLNLIPGVGPLISVLILAFGRWPIEDKLAALQGGGPAPSAPPGSSVMPTP